MPAFVNSNVGSLAGRSGDERTRACPCSSKYFKKASRISLPVIIRLSLPHPCHPWLMTLFSRSQARIQILVAADDRTGSSTRRGSLVAHESSDAFELLYLLAPLPTSRHRPSRGLHSQRRCQPF